MARLKGQLFARLSLDYFDHPKIAALSAEAIVAHLEMIVYSRRYGTDGHIPNRIANRFGFDSLSELASNDPERPSIAINDDGSVDLYGYSDMQETSEQIKARQQVNALNGQKGGRPKTQTKTHSVSESVSESQSETKPIRKAETETETELKENLPTVGKRKEPKRATQLPNDWQPTDAHRQLAASRGINCELEAEKMRDWARAKGETGKDWDARFRNWLRNAKPQQQNQLLDRRAQLMLADRQRYAQQNQARIGGEQWQIEQ